MKSNLRKLLARLDANTPDRATGVLRWTFLDGGQAPLERPRRAGAGHPYGGYAPAASTGWVIVGTDHDTAAFAVSAIGTW